MSKPILLRTYPYEVTRRCPKCGKAFPYTIHKPNQVRYYPRCEECLTKPRVYNTGAGPMAHREIVAPPTKAKKREHMLLLHSFNCALYQAELRKHMGLPPKKEEDESLQGPAQPEVHAMVETLPTGDNSGNSSSSD